MTAAEGPAGFWPLSFPPPIIVHDFTATPLTVLGPALGTPVITQKHILSAVPLIVDVPFLGHPSTNPNTLEVIPVELNIAPIGLGTPVMTQTHILTAQDLVVASVEFTPAIFDLKGYRFRAIDLVVAPPVFSIEEDPVFSFDASRLVDDEGNPRYQAIFAGYNDKSSLIIEPGLVGRTDDRGPARRVFVRPPLYLQNNELWIDRSRTDALDVLVQTLVNRIAVLEAATEALQLRIDALENP
jgi:hypothetical protein